MGVLSPKLSFLLSNTVNLGNWMKSSFYNNVNPSPGRKTCCHEYQHYQIAVEGTIGLLVYAQLSVLLQINGQFATPCIWVLSCMFPGWFKGFVAEPNLNDFSMAILKHHTCYICEMCSVYVRMLVVPNPQSFFKIINMYVKRK